MLLPNAFGRVDHERTLALASNKPRDAIDRVERWMPALGPGSNFHARAAATFAAAYFATGDPARGIAILERQRKPNVRSNRTTAG